VQLIIVRPRPNVEAGNCCWLVAGRHRLEAARKLKWEAIRAIIRDDLDEDGAALVEIDENLKRRELLVVERSLTGIER